MTHRLPLITTILPTYRRPALLRRAVASVLRQTCPDVRVLVLDNASGDETGAVAAEPAARDPRVVYHCHDRNLGPEANYQAGMERVETPYFSFMADDDLLLPDFYATALAELRRHPEAMFAVLAVAFAGDDGEISMVPLLGCPAGYYRGHDAAITMLKHGLPVWTGILFRREVLDAIGHLDIETVVDLDYLLRAITHCPFVVSLAPGALFSLDVRITRSGRLPYPFATLIWPGWLKMMESFAADETLPPRLRQEATQIMTARMRDRLFMDVVRFLYQDRLADAEKAAEVLGDYFLAHRQAALLKAAIALHRRLGARVAAGLWAAARGLWHRRQVPADKALDEYVAAHRSAFSQANREVRYQGVLLTHSRSEP